jgi:hypothetical protein
MIDELEESSVRNIIVHRREEFADNIRRENRNSVLN